jgi:hypothetical protein
MTYSLAFQYATAPIRLASACRKVHAALTGPKARAAKRLDGAKLEDTWESLTLCWEEFESLRPIQRSDHVTHEDTMRFVDGWQVSAASPINRYRANHTDNPVLDLPIRMLQRYPRKNPRSSDLSARSTIIRI